MLEIVLYYVCDRKDFDKHNGQSNKVNAQKLKLFQELYRVFKLIASYIYTFNKGDPWEQDFLKNGSFFQLRVTMTCLANS